MRHKQLLVVIIALIIGAVAVLAIPEINGKPWRIKRGLDIAGGVRIVYKADMEKLAPGQKPNEALKAAVRIITNRASGSMGVAEPIVQPKGTDQIVVELPDIEKEKKDQAISDLGSTAQMEFRHLKNVHYANATRWRPSAGKYAMTVSQDPKTGGDVFDFTDKDGNEIDDSVIIGESILKVSGDELKPESRVVSDSQTMGSVVALEFTPAGKKKFADFTRKNVGEILAIVLDGKILSAPTIDEPILNGSAVIRGKFTPAEAQRLAEFINAGALPVPLTVEQVQSVEATLGQASVNKSIGAGVYGLIAVVAFMLLYYLLPGLLADIALAVYALLTLAIFKLLGVTMTLPGIAAYILSIGMAVDANILIFERLKEELRSGKTLRAAIDTGFARAFTSIFDSNMCSLITCVILFNFGTGPIKGFAVVLAIGVIISMFTAITVTRTLLHTLTFLNAGPVHNPRWYGLGRQWVTGSRGREVDIVGRMRIWFAISALILLPGLYFWLGAGGLKLGIDFTGGSLTQVEFKQPVTSLSDIRGVLEKAGLRDSTIQKSKDNNKEVFIRTKTLTADKYLDVKSDIEQLGGNVLQSESVGPVVSEELKQNAINAVLIASVLIVLYLSVRFAIGGLGSGFRFGVCAIAATLHDVAAVLGIFAIFGHFLDWQIDSLFITALLTVIGFSTHDTIVIFDRIRENMRHRVKGDGFDAVANRSIMQSFARSINTSFTTILTLAFMVALGASNIRPFTVALLIGVVLGTYSSIFNASQLLVLWQRLAEKKKEPVVASSRPMIETPMVADLSKPIASGTESDGDAVGAGAAPSKSKSAAKKRKKRF